MTISMQGRMNTTVNYQIWLVCVRSMQDDEFGRRRVGSDIK